MKLPLYTGLNASTSIQLCALNGVGKAFKPPHFAKPAGAKLNSNLHLNAKTLENTNKILEV